MSSTPKGDAASPAADHDETDAVTCRVVLFDFDGVLMHGDSFYLFMRDLYARAFWRKLLAVLVAPLALLLWPISWRLPVFLLVRVALLGTGPKRYQAAAFRFASALARRPKQFCRDGLHALRRHQAAGDRVIVVTGCEENLVSGIVRELGLSDIEILASQLRPGWLGMRPKRHNIGRRKVTSLAQHGITACAVAYGDSLDDAAMLKLAAEAVLVNGTPAMCKKFEKMLGRTVTRVHWF